MRKLFFGLCPPSPPPPRDVSEGGRGLKGGAEGGVGWDPPPPRVPLWSPPKAGRKILKLQSSWHRRSRSKLVAVSQREARQFM